MAGRRIYGGLYNSQKAEARETLPKKVTQDEMF